MGAKFKKDKCEDLWYRCANHYDKNDIKIDRPPKINLPNNAKYSFDKYQFKKKHAPLKMLDGDKERKAMEC